MNKMKLLSLIVGAGLLVPCMSFAVDGNEQEENIVTSGVKTGLKFAGRTVGTVGCETLAACIALHGTSQFIKGLKSAGPGIGWVAWDTFCTCIGTESGDTEYGKHFGQAFLGSVQAMYGGILACTCLYGMADTIPSIFGWLKRTKVTKENIEKNAPQIVITALNTVGTVAPLL